MITLTSRVLEHLFTPYVNETQWRRTRGFAAAHQDSPARVQPPAHFQEGSITRPSHEVALAFLGSDAVMHALSVLAPMQGGTWMAQLVRPQQMTCTCIHTVCILNLRKVGSCKQDFGSIPGLWSIQNSSKPFSTGPSKFEKHSLSSLPLATSLDGFVHFRSETNRSTLSGQVLYQRYQSYECATRVSLDNGELLYFWLILTVEKNEISDMSCD